MRTEKQVKATIKKLRDKQIAAGHKRAAAIGGSMEEFNKHHDEWSKLNGQIDALVWRIFPWPN